MFCLYEHWRPDKKVCFYVGKGKRRRANDCSARNERYGRIVAKLKRQGLSVEVRIIQSGMSNDEAISAEVAHIAALRSAGVDLCNYTDGGDGTAGYKHRNDTKETLREMARRRRASEATKKKMSASRTGRKHTAATRLKMSASAKAAQTIRFQKQKETTEGRKALAKSMLHLARFGRGTPEYTERKRQAALVRWSRCTSRSVIPGFS